MVSENNKRINKWMEKREISRKSSWKGQKNKQIVIKKCHDIDLEKKTVKGNYLLARTFFGVIFPINFFFPMTNVINHVWVVDNQFLKSFSLNI